MLQPIWVAVSSYDSKSGEELEFLLPILSRPCIIMGRIVSHLAKYREGFTLTNSFVLSLCKEFKEDIFAKKKTHCKVCFR